MVKHQTSNTTLGCAPSMNDLSVTFLDFTSIRISLNNSGEMLRRKRLRGLEEERRLGKEESKQIGTGYLLR